MPPSDVVVINVTAAADALYIQDLDGGLGRLRRLPYESGTASSVKLPFEGAIQTLFTNPKEEGTWLELTSWMKSPVWYALSASGTAQDTHIAPPSPVDFSQIESEEVKAKSADRWNHGAALDYPPTRNRNGRFASDVA